jgi:U3 small nucleolar RNA-associated protein 18
MGMMADL